MTKFQRITHNFYNKMDHDDGFQTINFTSYNTLIESLFNEVVPNELKKDLNINQLIERLANNIINNLLNNEAKQRIIGSK